MVWRGRLRFVLTCAYPQLDSRKRSLVALPRRQFRIAVEEPARFQPGHPVGREAFMTHEAPANAIPVFGPAIAGAEYILRPGGYALILTTEGDLAVVSTPVGLALPGGGVNAGELPQAAAVREVREECGLCIKVGDCIGIADELVYAEDEDVYYRKRCAFFVAKIVQHLGAGEPDHFLQWLSPERAAGELLHESQRWAVKELMK
jgi:8-oxo-dGTP diphosphatase